jgi:spermidine/putrescine transport system substrate-binding protein
MRHPRDRNPFWSPMSRREFIKRSAGATVAFSSAGAFLAACGGGTTPGAGGTSGGLQIASPDDPQTLAITDDNQPIASNLEPEAGPLKVYNWDEYIWPKILKRFEKEVGVEVELTGFYNMEEGIAKVRTEQVDFDIFFPTIDFVSKLSAAKLIQPLNHDYLPNLEANIWPQLVNPFYDQGSRYSVPYVVYTTGVAWRTDLVSEDIAARANPYEALWDPQYRGKVGIYDDYREAMSMALLKNGIADVNTDDPTRIDMARNELTRMTDAVNVRTTIDGAYAGLPESRFAVVQAWSGDIVAAPYYMPAAQYGDPDGVLRYWYPDNGKGLVGNDTIVIPRNASNPVLAHMFLNFLLEDQNAIDNFSWVGYQPPLNSIVPEQLVKDGYVLENIATTIVREEQFDTGYRILTLPSQVDQLWLNAWSQFKAGVPVEPSASPTGG